MAHTKHASLIVGSFIQVTRIGIVLHPPARVEEARLKVVADEENLLRGQTPPLWVRNEAVLR